MKILTILKTLVVAIIATLGLSTTVQAEQVQSSECNFYKTKQLEYTKLVQDGKSNELKRKYDMAGLESYRARFNKNCVVASIEE